jgi:hypothetical protein
MSSVEAGSALAMSDIASQDDSAHVHNTAASAIIVAEGPIIIRVLPFVPKANKARVLGLKLHPPPPPTQCHPKVDFLQQPVFYVRLSITARHSIYANCLLH